MARPQQTALLRSYTTVLLQLLFEYMQLLFQSSPHMIPLTIVGILHGLTSSGALPEFS